MVMYKFFGDFLKEDSPDYEGLFLQPTLRYNLLPFSYAISGVISARNYIFMQRLHPNSSDGVQHKEMDERHAAFYRWKLEIHVLISLIFSPWSVIQLPDWLTKICQIFFRKYLWGYSLKSSAFKASGQVPWGVLEMTKQTHSDCMEIKQYFVGLTNLGCEVLWSTSNCLSTDQLMKKMNWLYMTINWSIDEKKWIDFVEIKFHLNENVEWHSILNWIPFLVELNSNTEFQCN